MFHRHQHLPQAPVQCLQVGLSQDRGQQICSQRLSQHITQAIGLGGQQLQPQVSGLLDAARDEEGEVSIGGASPQQQIQGGWQAPYLQHCWRGARMDTSSRECVPKLGVRRSP